MNDNQKVCVFGIDGATFSVMNPLIEQGYLPTIESIMKHGTAAVCTSTIPPFSCPAWKSFATGMNPGKLGLYDLLYKEPGTYSITPSRADYVDVPDLWEILSENGFRVGVFNVPGTYPPRQVNGWVISGMLGNYEAPDFMYPRNLREEIEPLFDSPYLIEADLTTSSGPDEWLAEQHAITDMKVTISHHLLTHTEWDFFIAVLYEVDRVQHTLWHYMDKNHPRYTPSHLESAIRNSYQRMDTILKDIIDVLPENTTLIIMSDHGFGPINGFFRLNQWLLSKGYLKLNEESKKLFFEQVTKRFLKDESPPMTSQSGQPSDTVGGMYQIDWSQTTAFSVRLGNMYLNVRGREPQGIIEMGKEYDTVRNQLIKDLLTISHPSTGENIHVTVHKKEDVYSGVHFQNAPDLLVSLEDYSYLIEQGFGPMWGGEEGKYSTGGHKMDGIFMATGNHIIPDQWIDPISIIDIAPTILHIMGVEIPPDMDGNLLSGLFGEQTQKQTQKQKKTH